MSPLGFQGSERRKPPPCRAVALRFGSARIITSEHNPQTSKDKLLGPRTRHSSACVPQHNPSIAQRSATRIGGWISVTWVRRVLIGADKQGWSNAPAVKLSEAVAERGRWRAASRAVPSSGEADRDQGEMSDFPHQVQVGLVEDCSLTSVNTLPRLVRASVTNPSDATATATGLPSITW